MGWSRSNACIYERTFALTCRGVVEPLLDAVADRLRLEGSEVLDVGSGTGRLAAAATRRGAVVTAVDPDPAMIREAQRLRPDAVSRLLVALIRTDGQWRADLTRRIGRRTAGRRSRGA